MKQLLTSAFALTWAIPAAAQEPKQALNQESIRPTFCQDYVELAGDLAGIAKWFLIAALALGIAYAIVETIKKYQEEAAAPRMSVSAVKEVVDALKTFVEALANARAWLAIFACGVLLFWVGGNMVPAACGGDMIKAYWAS